jgi:hypothetical protein
MINSIKWYGDKELERIWPNEGTIMALYDGTEENHENLSQDSLCPS